MKRRIGQILSVDCLRGFGFIRPRRGRNVYFGKRALVDLEFDPGIVGRRVSFRAVEQPGCRSLAAIEIRILTPRRITSGKAYGFKLRNA